MDDEKVWDFEESLWTGDAEHYAALVDHDCLMVLPTPPFVFSGEQAIRTVSNTPRWTKVELSERQVFRPQEGIIVIAYGVSAEQDGVAPYQAHCTSTYRRLAPDEWRVIQHQQTPPLVSG